MEVKYLDGKPEPKDPLMVAIIAPKDAEYDNECIGDDVWPDPDVPDDEEYDSAFGCMWPACEMAGFEHVTSGHLSTMEKIDLQTLLSEISLSDLQEDLKKIDHIFLIGEESAREIKIDSLVNHVDGATIEFIEYEGN